MTLDWPFFDVAVEIETKAAATINVINSPRSLSLFLTLPAPLSLYYKNLDDVQDSKHDLLARPEVPAAGRARP